MGVRCRASGSRGAPRGALLIVPPGAEQRKETVIMKRMRTTLGVGFVIAVMGFLGMTASVQAQSVAPLLESVEAALLEALTGPEGEYAAYASYAVVIEEYGNVEPYATIADAELRHIEALQRLLDKYGVSYPAANPYLGTIEAPADLATAAQAWADGEIANVELYDELLAAVEGYSDITRVFLNLQFASQEAHLPAFQLAAENGGTLTPGQIVDQIASYQQRNGVEGLVYGEKGMIRWRGGK